MANGIRTDDPRGFNKGRSSKICEGSRVRQTPEEGRRTYRPKRYGNNNKDEDNSPKTLNDKNQQASSQKFRQLILKRFLIWFVQFLKKKRHKSKFSWLAQLFEYFFIKIQPNVSEQEKEWQRIYD